MERTGTLYVVGTPIGNLEDITLRALRVLSEADLILCEDTRVTKKLLSRHHIVVPTESFHTHSSASKVQTIIESLAGGKQIALVTDAGTPGISDPGSLLVSEVRMRAPSARIETIPGPSALTAFISVAGLPISDFVFLGFLPHKKGRQTLFREIAESRRSVIFYESPHRILKTLAALRDLLPPGRPVRIGRELTKKFEEVILGDIESVYERVLASRDKQRGEFVVLIGV